MKQLQRQHKVNGFSLPEILVSSSLLMMVVAGTGQGQINSVVRTADASAQNAVQARITQDLNNLRSQAFSWQCIAGTSCTGNVQFADISMRYDTTSTALKSACNTQTMGAAMISGLPNINQAPAILSWPNEAPKEAQSVEITRKITASGNEIQVNYSTTGSSRNLNQTAVIIPQAASWCA